MSFPQQPPPPPPYGPPPHQPSPPPPSGQVQWGVVIAGMLVAIVAMLGLVGAVVALQSSDQPNGANSTPTLTPIPAPTSDAPLQQLVLYKHRLGFSVCGRQQLHRCTLLFVTNATGDRATIRIGPFDVDPVPSCETISGQAAQTCADAGADPLTYQGPSNSWFLCAARHGLIYRGGAMTSHVDPRDEDLSARPGHVRLQCNEGYRTGEFEDTL